MTPIITTNSSPAGRVKRVKAPPASGSTEFTPNRPSGFTTFSDTTFASAAATDIPWGFDYNTYAPPADPDNLSFVTTADGPYLGTSMAGLNAAGIVNGGGIIAAPFPAQIPRSRQTLYTSIVFKQSANFQTHPSSGKFLYPRAHPTTEGQPSPQNYQMQFQPVGAVTSGQFQWKLESQPTGVSGDNYNENLTPTVMNVDTWYRLELVTTPNTDGVADGTAQWWTSQWNGSSWNSPVYNASHTGIRFMGTGETLGWISPRIDTYHGGNAASPTLPEDQYIYINRCLFAYGVV